ncbi:MAG: hypothetical protein QOG83_2499 [Alphaproteobacteria bacterium]|nr:hypothetical protein [Alphaproteobacteria bacterium]
MPSTRGHARPFGVARAIVLVAAAVLFTVSEPASISRTLGQPAEALAQPVAPSTGAAEHPPGLPASGEAATWQKRWWMDKTARLLRGGDGLGTADDVDALLKLPEDEIVRRFMNDPRFGDTVLDFNMFYLGFKIDALKANGVYKRNVFDFANAIASTQELLKGGDYFKLFDLEGPFYMAPLPLEFDDPLPPDEVDMLPETARRKAIQEAEDEFLDLVLMGSGRVPPSAAAYCAEVEKLSKSVSLHVRLVRAFNDPEVFFLLRGRVISGPLEILEQVVDAECDGRPPAKVNIKRLTAGTKRAYDQFRRAVTEILKFEPSVYQPRSVRDFKAFDLRAFRTDSWLAFGFEQSTALKNSSTNFNRKRGAYVLKRFFCDDLTPVGFETPQEHVAGAHGSDTPCFACHYKLDPMSGFFRNRGADFFNYSNDTVVVFDDDASSDRKKYEANWLAQKGSPRKWSVGYIRSARWDDQNSYGDKLTDLSRIIRNAPEAKRCLTKRMFEYFIAEDQTFDGGYLEEFTRQFEREAAVNSSTAFKNAVTRIVLSKTYREINADPQQCYDHAPNAQVDNAPPCRVAFILQKNCAQCHSGGDPSAGLDLTNWVTAPDGRTRTFPHLGRDRQQTAAQDTLTRIAERLSATDPAVRMPKMTAMSSQERQELFLWAQDELARASKEPPQ